MLDKIYYICYYYHVPKTRTSDNVYSFKLAVVFGKFAKKEIF